MKRNLPTLFQKIVATTCLCLALPFSAQAFEPIRWGVVVGTNLSSHSEHPTSDRKWGMQFGAKALMDINTHFYLEGNALFTQKGYKTSVILDSEYKRNIYALEIPIHIGYKYAIVPSGIELFVSGGPYLGLGLFGKYKEYNMDGTISSRNLYKSGTGDNRFDLGAGIKGGVQLGENVQFAVGYDWGFLKANKHLSGSKNQNLYMTLVYLF